MRSSPRLTPTPVRIWRSSSTARAAASRATAATSWPRFSTVRADDPRPRARQQGRGDAGRQPPAPGPRPPRLNTALARRSRAQIVQLVDASSKVFRASRPRQGNISRAVADLPGTLSQTTATLAQVQAFADQLGPTGEQPAPSRACTAGGQRGARGARQAARPRSCRSRSVRSWSQRDRSSTTSARRRRSRDGDAESAEGVRRPQPPRQHARLLPGRRSARLPVVAGVARAQHAHAVLAAGRQRPVPPAVHPVQLPTDRDVDQSRLAVRTRRRAAEPHAAETVLPGAWAASRRTRLASALRPMPPTKTSN